MLTNVTLVQDSLNPEATRYYEVDDSLSVIEATNVAKPSGSLTAISANILRFISMFDSLSFAIN